MPKFEILAIGFTTYIIVEDVEAIRECFRQLRVRKVICNGKVVYDKNNTDKLNELFNKEAR